MRWLLEPKAFLSVKKVDPSVSSSSPASSSGNRLCTGIAFATINHKSLSVPYVEDLLISLKRFFLAHCSCIDDCKSFDKIFDKILVAMEMEGEKDRNRLPPAHSLYISHQGNKKSQQKTGMEDSHEVENSGHSQKAVGSNNRSLTPEQSRTKKKGTVWYDESSERKITKKAMESLDKSKVRGGAAVDHLAFCIHLYES